MLNSALHAIFNLPVCAAKTAKGQKSALLLHSDTLGSVGKLKRSYQPELCFVVYDEITANNVPNFATLAEFSDTIMTTTVHELIPEYIVSYVFCFLLLILSNIEIYYNKKQSSSCLYFTIYNSLPLFYVCNSQCSRMDWIANGLVKTFRNALKITAICQRL